jgi:hypothetical protein
MTERPVRTALPHRSEARTNQQGFELARLQSRYRPHPLRDSDGLEPHELGLQLRLSILEEHRDDLAEVSFELVERFALAVRTRPTGDRTDQEAGFGIPLDDDVEGDVSLSDRWLESKLTTAPPGVFVLGSSAEPCLRAAPRPIGLTR